MWLGFSISTLYAENRKTIIQKVICTPVITTASFKIAMKWKQHKCPQMEEWIKKDVMYVCVCVCVYIYNVIPLSHREE